MLSYRGIKSLVEFENFSFLDNDNKVIFKAKVDYEIGLPILKIKDILDLDEKDFNFINYINKSDINSLSIKNMIKNRKNKVITKEEFNEAVYLHERMNHANPSVMSRSIKNNAWTGVKADWRTIDKIFYHYQCESCAMAKWNKEAIQIGLQIPVTKSIGSHISGDRVPFSSLIFGDYTGYYGRIINNRT
jgi:hypothetical protein